MAAVILAAGGSRRLGEAKQLVMVGGERLLPRTLRVVFEAGLKDVFVVLGARADEIKAEVDLGGVRVVENAAWEEGIASSIRAGVEAVRDECVGAEALMLLVCDQAALSSHHLQALLRAYRSGAAVNIAASVYAGVRGIPAVFRRGEWEKLMALEGDRGARVLLQDPGCALATVEWAEGEVDVDTVEDLQRLRRT